MKFFPYEEIKVLIPIIAIGRMMITSATSAFNEEIVDNLISSYGKNFTEHHTIMIVFTLGTLITLFGLYKKSPAAR